MLPAPPRAIKNGPRVKNEPFHRVNVEEATALIEHETLADNSYKGTFGSAGWGAAVPQPESG